MRLAPSSGLFALLLVCGLACGACNDDSAIPNTSNVPGDSNDPGFTGEDTGDGTGPPAISDPQMTPAPNPNAGGGNQDAGTGSAP